MGITLTFADLTEDQAHTLLDAFTGSQQQQDTPPPAQQAAPAPSAAFTPVQPVAGGPAGPLSTAATGAPSAPSAPATAASGAGSTVDKDGLPWDDRIHASSKALNADGTWRRRRNLDPATLAAVETELRARQHAHDAKVVTSGPLIDDAPPPPAQQQAAPPPVTNPFPPPVQQGRPPMSVEQLLSAMSVAVAGKYIESIPVFLQGFGMTLTDMLNPANAAALPAIQAALEGMGEPE